VRPLSKRPKTKKTGHVKKIVPPIEPGQKETAEIVVRDAVPLYRELRIDNQLHDESGQEVKLKNGAEVEVIVETDSSNTVPTKNWSASLTVCDGF
jgi:hypothetical protein